MGRIANTLSAAKIIGLSYLDHSGPRFIPPKLDDKGREILEAVKSKGYYVWKGFYTRETCQELIKEVDTLIERKRGLKVYDDSDIRIYAGHKYSDKINSFNKNELLNDVAENFLGMRATAFFTLSAKITYKEGNLGSGQGWHRDTYRPFQFKAMVYLTDVDEASGPFELIEGSHTKFSLIEYAAKNDIPPNQHRFTEKEVEVLSRGKERRIFVGNAGDLIIFNSYCIHRGAPLKSGFRYALTNYYYPIHVIERNRESLEKKFNLNG
ncbi:MAG TPA: phytanoyl-CoA dioxygenase family protein [Cyclobacteriaceae bacterium]|jgi:hypothetical protein|nr:phytanoyl-CoA dioxygenase family protein [Cyclobacteriaceae bacterium]